MIIMTVPCLLLLCSVIMAKVGLYHDIPVSVMPHATTGRADYFGILVNRAARLMSSASQGTIFADAQSAGLVMNMWRKQQAVFGSEDCDVGSCNSQHTRSFSTARCSRVLSAAMLSVEPEAHTDNTHAEQSNKSSGLEFVFTGLGRGSVLQRQTTPPPERAVAWTGCEVGSDIAAIEPLSPLRHEPSCSSKIKSRCASGISSGYFLDRLSQRSNTWAPATHSSDNASHAFSSGVASQLLLTSYPITATVGESTVVHVCKGGENSNNNSNYILPISINRANGLPSEPSRLMSAVNSETENSSNHRKSGMSTQRPCGRSTAQPHDVQVTRMACTFEWDGCVAFRS